MIILVNRSISEPIKVRQMHERDLAIKEASLIKDNLNVEISTLRQELQLSLEEVRNLDNPDLVTQKIVVWNFFQGKRNRENDRITHLEENNRLNQRIDQLEGRNQQLQDKVTKSKWTLLFIFKITMSFT